MSASGWSELASDDAPSRGPGAVERAQWMRADAILGELAAAGAVASVRLNGVGISIPPAPRASLADAIDLAVRVDPNRGYSFDDEEGWCVAAGFVAGQTSALFDTDRREVGFGFRTTSPDEWRRALAALAESGNAWDARLACLAWHESAQHIVAGVAASLSFECMSDGFDPGPADARVFAMDDGGVAFIWDRGRVAPRSYAGAFVRLAPEHTPTVCGECFGCKPAPVPTASRGPATPVSPVASWVYFIQSGKSGPIKIGRSNNVEGRLATFQTGHHEELRLLCRVPGGAALEAALHEALSDDALRGEWFRPSPRVLALVRELGGG